MPRGFTLQNLARAAEARRHQRSNPEAVAPAVRSMDAIGELLGRGDGSMVARMKADPLGRKLLAERHDILALVSDRDYLRLLPDGSLGREYCRFAETNELFPETLAASVREARAETDGRVPNASDEAAYLHDRFRDLHDVWHVLTGYGTDMAGEWGLIAFQTRQVGYRSMAMMAFLNLLGKALRGRFDLLRTWLEGRRRGAKARYLLAQDWERLMPMPLEQVRAELEIDRLAPYRTWDYPQSPARLGPSRMPSA